MQQYFIDKKIEVGENIKLRDDIIFHLSKVLRNTNNLIRLVDDRGDIYLCEFINNEAYVKEKLNENNELDVNITVILSLFKQDKFEFAIQKLTELGVKRIVPYNAHRSVVKENKPERKLERYKKILVEASEQCHRNFVPEIYNAINLDEVPRFLSEINIIAYEKEDGLYKDSFKANSITIVIGPEGGFEEEEVNEFINYGFKPISLGKRILRAETASIYLTSLIIKDNEK